MTRTTDLTQRLRQRVHLRNVAISTFLRGYASDEHIQPMLCSILKKRWNSSVLRMSVDGKSHLFAVLWRVAGATGCGRIASLLRTHRSQVFSDRVHTQSTIADYPISRLHRVAVTRRRHGRHSTKGDPACSIIRLWRKSAKPMASRSLR